MKRVSKAALSVLMVGLTLGASGCGRRPLTPPQDLGKPPAPPVTQPPPYPDPQPTASPDPTDPGTPTPLPTAAPTADPGTPDPQPTGEPTAVPTAGPSDPAPPPAPQQPVTDVEFWTMIAKMGFALPKEEIQKQIVDASQRRPDAWSPGRINDVTTNLAEKFADNQKYFLDPPATAEEYAKRGLDFAARTDANTSYYIDLRYSLKGGGGKVVVLKFDQVTFEVLGSNTRNQINWYTQWRGVLKLPSYLYIPATVYQQGAKPSGDVGAASYRRYF